MIYTLHYLKHPKLWNHGIVLIMLLWGTLNYGNYGTVLTTLLPIGSLVVPFWDYLIGFYL